eukprot:UN07008
MNDLMDCIEEVKVANNTTKKRLAGEKDKTKYIKPAFCFDRKHEDETDSESEGDSDSDDWTALSPDTVRGISVLLKEKDRMKRFKELREGLTECGIIDIQDDYMSQEEIFGNR